MRSIYTLLTTRRFFPLFVAQFLGAFNDNLFRTALVTMVTFQMVELSNAAREQLVTLAIGLFMLPYFLVSVTAGQLADKYDKARMIRIVKFTEILVMAVGVLGFAFSNLPLLLFALFLTGVQATFFGPVKYSILPDHLKKTELVMGNGLIEMATFLAILLGTIAGGLVMAEHVAGTTRVSIYVIGIATIGFLFTLAIPSTKPAHPEQEVRYNFFKATWKLIRFSRGDHLSFFAIIGISWFWLVGAMFLSQLPIIAKDTLRVNESTFTMLLSLFSVGIGIGSILASALLKGEVTVKFAPITALLMGLMLIDFSAIDYWFDPKGETLIGISEFLAHASSWRVITDLVMVGMFGGLFIVPLYAVLQHRSDVRFRSQMVAANNVLNALFMVISSVAGMALLASGFSVPELFMAMSAAHMVMVAYVFHFVKKRSKA